MYQPLISIITPSLNRALYIREAIQSVLDQNYPYFEHIIIDAVSTDGTLDILREYPHLRVISEPDNGMYDAINKGILMARGEIIGLLNTDDLYAPDCFDRVVNAFGNNPSALAICGGISVFKDRDGGQEFISHIQTIEEQELWYRLIQGHPVTNAWFFRKNVFDQAGHFDANFRYAADRYFLIKIALDCGVRPAPVFQELYYYRQHSGSVTIHALDSRIPQYGLLRIKVLLEDIIALECFLDRPVLPGEVRQRMLREHGERCYRLATTSLYHQRWRQGANAIQRGWHRNILWPLIFLQMALLRLRKEFIGHEK
jgi:glycosyltransferase involved in cell wall biosynthesis